MPGRETHLKQQQQIMSGVARDSGQVGMFGPADSGSRIIVTKTDHIISSSMDRVVSLDYSIITLEHRVETLNFLFFSFLFFLSSFFFFFFFPLSQWIRTRRLTPTPPGADSHHGLSWRVNNGVVPHRTCRNHPSQVTSHLPQTPKQRAIATWPKIRLIKSRI